MKPSDKTRGKRILVVDDEPASTEGAVLELKARGFQVDEAHTLADAVRLLRQTQYDALLLDLMLPLNEINELKRDPPLAANGLEVLRRLFNGNFEPEGTSRQIPVFAISALGPEAKESIGEARQLGTREIFGKPVPTIRIAETIRLTLEDK
jgi:CheY-like chemotaxis protein